MTAATLTAPPPALFGRLPAVPTGRRQRAPWAMLAAARSAGLGVRSPARSTSSAKLARDLKRGKDGAIDRLYEEYGSTTFGFLRSMLRDDHAAEDVQQQVYLEAWQRAASYDPDRGSLLTWLLTIARSRGLDHFRKRTPEPVDPTDPTAIPADHHHDGQLDGLIEEWRVSHMLSRIPRDEAEMLRLRFYEDLSQSQIAERTGIPLGTVKLRMVNGLSRLRSEFDADGEPA